MRGRHCSCNTTSWALLLRSFTFEKTEARNHPPNKWQNLDSKPDYI